MWAFSETIDGMSEACRAFDTPVISGNVSFYNETEGRGIHPTPIIGMVGLIEDVRRVVQPGFKKEGDLIALLGTTDDDLSISAYAAIIEQRTVDEMIAHGRVPALDLLRERSVQATCLRAAEAGLLHSAHDCADGGLIVALAEYCFSSLNRSSIGAHITLCSETLPVPTSLFSESPSRIIISFDVSAGDHIQEIAEELNCPITLLGRVGGEELRVAVNGETIISAQIDAFERAWRSALGRKLEAQAVVVAAGAE